jgi:thioredoxin-related protein
VLLPVFTIALFLTACSKKSTEPEPKESLTWVSTAVLYDTTIEKKDHSLLFFFTDWCYWCQKLKKETLTDPRVVRVLNESFNISQVNPQADSLVVYFDTTVTCGALANIYDVKSIPQTCVLDRPGDLLVKISGYKTPDQFLQMLESIRNGSTKTEHVMRPK